MLISDVLLFLIQFVLVHMSDLSLNLKENRESCICVYLQYLILPTMRENGHAY